MNTKKPVPAILCDSCGECVVPEEGMLYGPGDLETPGFVCPLCGEEFDQSDKDFCFYLGRLEKRSTCRATLEE